MTGSVDFSTPIGRVRHMPFEEPKTIWELYHDLEIPQNKPVICVVDGRPVLRKDWNVYINPSQKVGFITIPQGGMFRQILGLLAFLVLAVFAPWAGGIIAGALGITSALGIKLISAGIFIAGSFLINALLAPPKPKDPPAASPTYSINAQGNVARLYDPIPKLYGNHILYPDFASMPYGEYESNNHYLNQLFCLGLGRYEVSSIRIEDTEIWNSEEGVTDSFPGVKVQIRNPGQEVTLFHTAVEASVEVGGQVLPHPAVDGNIVVTDDGYSVTTSGDDKFDEGWNGFQEGDKCDFTIGGNVYTSVITGINKDGLKITVDPPLPVGSSGDSGVCELNIEDQWVGPYPVNSASTGITKIAVDILFPNGIYRQDKEGDFQALVVEFEVQARKINSAGLPTGGLGWQTIGRPSYTGRTPTAKRYTEEYEVDRGRYEVRIRRVTIEKAKRHTYTSTWGGLRGYVPHDNIYKDVTVLALRMRANGVLTNEASRKVNVIQTAIIPVYDGTKWTEQPTRSIAWAAIDAAHNSLYGGNIAYSRIDIPKFQALDAIWTERGDYFDGVFDQRQTLWEALSAILRVGRGSPLQVGGILSAYRDEPRKLARGVFSPRNILRGSFQSTHILYDDESPDDVIVEFMDRRSWKMNRVQCTLPESTSERPIRMQMFGISDRKQAFREGIYTAAVNVRRRIFAAFGTELEGRLLLRGDQCIVSHDLFKWGVSGEVVSYTKSGRLMQLSQPVTFSPGQNHYIILHREDNSQWGPVIVTDTGDPYVVKLSFTDSKEVEESFGKIPVAEDDGDELRTRFIFAVGEKEVKKWLLVSAIYRDGDAVDLVVVNDDPSVYTADEQKPPSENFPYGSVDPYSLPVIDSFNVILLAGTDPVTLRATWTTTSFRDYFILQYSYDREEWFNVTKSNVTSHDFTIGAGYIFFRVAGVRNKSRGDWLYYSAKLGTQTNLPGTPTNVLIEYTDDEGIEVTWDPSMRSTTYVIEIRRESVLGVSGFDILIGTYERSGKLIIDSDDITSLGGPWVNPQARVYGKNSYGLSPAYGSDITALDGPGTISLSLADPYRAKGFAIDWNPASKATSYRVVIKSGDGLTTIRTTTITGTYYSYTAAMMEDDGGPLHSYVVEVTPKRNVTFGDVVSITVRLSGLTNYWSVDGATIQQDLVSAADLSLNSVTAVTLSAPRNKVLSFDDSGDAGNTTATLAQSYTKAAWIYPSTLTGTRAIIGGLVGSGTAAQHHVLYMSGSELRGGQAGTLNHVTHTIGAANTWYHVALTYDAGSQTMKLYVDGTLVDTQTVVPSIDANTGMRIGNYSGSPTFGWMGYLDDVMIFNRALNSTEIQALKTGG